MSSPRTLRAVWLGRAAYEPVHALQHELHEARKERRIGEQVGKWVMTNLSFLVPARYKAIEAGQVAKAMVHMMNSGKAGIHVLESQEIAAI